MTVLDFCLTQAHDARLTILAFAACLFSSLVGLKLLMRARGETGAARSWWYHASAGVLGLGVWSTHFAAMVAYEPGVPVGFATIPTLASAALGAVVIGVGLAVAMPRRTGPWRAAVAGGTMAVGTAVLHYVGMLGMAVPGHVSLDIVDVAASVALSLPPACLAMVILTQGNDRRGLFGAGVLFSISVLILHFGGMAGVSVTPDPSVGMPDTISREMVGAIVALAMGTVAVLGLAGLAQDFRLVRIDRQRARQMMALADAAFEGIAIFRGGRLASANAGMGEILGRPADDLVGKTVADLLGQDAADEACDRARTGNDQEFEASVSRGDGSVIPVEVRCRSVLNADDPQLVLAVRDIADRKEKETHIRHLALHDGLTGLPNREQLALALDGIVDRAVYEGADFAVHFIDLDRFKEINDQHGHEGGDTVLREVSRRLARFTGPDDIVARIGGDEMVFLQYRVSRDKAGASADEIVAELSSPVVFGSARIDLGASIGIAMFPEDATNRDALLRNADLALYRAKADGRGTAVSFDKSMEAERRRRWTLQHDLRHAVAEGQAYVVYQPQVRVADGRTVGYEALARWDHPTLGEIPPSEFIPIAEEAGLIGEIGQFVLRQACADASGWDRSISVSVNLSPVQVLRQGLADAVRDILAETGLEPGRLELEITEGVLIRDTGQAMDVLLSLKALGVRIAMDDFGTGYSSLSYLQSFPFDRIKIDRSFVMNLEGNPQSKAIIHAVCALAQGLGIPVTAEGVETEEQLAFLARETCELAQGYYIGRPRRLETAGMPRIRAAG